MVTAHHLLPDDIIHQNAPQTLAQHEVVETPANIGGPRVPHVAPEGVGARPRRIQGAKRVEKAVGQQVGEALPLLARESGRLAVRLRVRQVDFLVGDVQVAAPDHRLHAVQLLELLAERPFPCQAVLEAHEAAARVRYVGVDEEEVGVLGYQGSALFGELLLVCFGVDWRK